LLASAKKSKASERKMPRSQSSATLRRYQRSKRGGPLCARAPVQLSEAEAHAIAAGWHDRWIKQHRDNPSEQSWPISLADAMWKQGVINTNTYMTDEVRSHLQEVQTKIQNAENWCRAKATESLA
jgi:hypothetical protein